MMPKSSGGGDQKMPTFSQALISKAHIHIIRQIHQTEIISARTQTGTGRSITSIPGWVVGFPFLHICICLCYWFPSLSPPLPEHRVLPFQHTQRPHCSCFGWFVLNLSRHRVTSQHCIDSSTRRSASLPRPRTRTCVWPYPWPWWWQNVGNWPQMVQQFGCS